MATDMQLAEKLQAVDLPLRMDFAETEVVVLTKDSFVSLQRFRPECMDEIHLSPELVAHYGQLVLSYNVWDYTRSGQPLAHFEEICAGLSQQRQGGKSVYHPYSFNEGAIAPAWFYAYGEIRPTLSMLVDKGILSEKEAVPLFECIERELLRITGLSIREDSLILATPAPRSDWSYV